MAYGVGIVAFALALILATLGVGLLRRRNDKPKKEFKFIFIALNIDNIHKSALSVGIMLLGFGGGIVSAPRGQTPGPIPPPAPKSDPPLPAPQVPTWIVGRWTFPDTTDCRLDFEGFVTLEENPSRLRFEWHYPDRTPNVAYELIEKVGNGFVATVNTVDRSTPTPQIGHRIEYSKTPDGWQSYDYQTGVSQIHHRC